ncbi:MAG: cytochrome c4 [Sinobacteraceae bacterium]|nr:cytochrome c4 [Nevskiaceae bacterium]MBV9318223.1 cytochrome c4 [Gammaproteobacteria bacterium]
MRWFAAALLRSLLVVLPAIAIGQAPAAPPETGAAPPAAQGAPAAQAAPAQSAPPLDPFKDGDVARGTAKAAVCSACHGANGNSTSPDWPRLAGQSAVYIVEQLRLFRSGVRNNPIMKPLASTLSDQDIDDLAVYYQAQTPSGLEADPSYWQAGEALYVRGDSAHDVPACVACHGPVGRGNLSAGYPALRAQQSVYVVKQLNDYASGARYTGSNPAAASRNGVMMFAIARRLTPEQIRDVASYVQGMR